MVPPVHITAPHVGTPTHKIRTAKTNAMEIEKLQNRIDELETNIQRIESRHEKTLEAHTNFISDLAASSAVPKLDDYVNFRSKEIVAKGNFGFIFTCKGYNHEERVIVKVQRPSQGDIVANEWHHGSNLGKHPHIIKHYSVFLHSDKDGELQRFFDASFDSGALKGNRPRLYPESYFCIIEEYMDGGDAEQLIARGLLELEGVAAITRQIADAVGYMHDAECTHNDIKPANILFKVGTRSPSGHRVRLEAKLADLGSTEYSLDRTKDYNFFAYTIWCLALGCPFKKCPRGKIEQDAAVNKLCNEAPWGTAPEALKEHLPNVVTGLWSGEAKIQKLRNAAWSASCELMVVGLLPRPDSGLEKTIKLNVKRAAHVSQISTPRAYTLDEPDKEMSPPKVENLSPKVENLLKRFPTFSREEVERGLQEAGGHAGRAAAFLDASDKEMKSSKVDNLLRRFPSFCREEVQWELQEACGHAGRAATALQKMEWER